MPSTLKTVIEDFIQEYAWHARNCASVDYDGEWRKGNPPCDCGFDKDKEHILFLVSVGERLDEVESDLEKI